MTAIEQRQPALPKRIARQGSRAPAALRVLLACALAFSMIPLALALCPPSKDAVAHEPAVAQPRYPSLTDYLSRAQNERLVGGDVGATFAAQEGGEQHDDAANESDTPADAPMHEGNQPGADATSADNVQAAAAGAPSHASATEGQAPEPSAGQTEGPEAATTPEGTTDPAEPEGTTTDKEASGADADAKADESPDSADGSASDTTHLPGNVLDLFSAAATASEQDNSSERDDPSEDDYASTGHDLYLKYLLADSTLVSDGDTIDDIFTSEEKILRTVIAQYSATADLLDPGPESDYYLALMDTTRFLGNTRALDAEFARTDNLGHVVDGPLFDRDTGIAYVPKSLYGTDETMSIVAQVLFSYDLASSADVLVDLHVESANAQVDAIPSQSVRTNALDVTTTFPIVSPATADRISLRNLTVYINGSSSPYVLKEGRNAAYDRTTGELTIFYSPMNLYSVEVRINGRSLADAIMRAPANVADAATDPSALATFPGVCFDGLDLDTLHEGDWFTYQAATNYVWPNPAPGDVSKDVRDFCVPYCYGYANDPESLYDLLQSSGTDWDDVGNVGLVAESQYFNCVIGTPDEIINGQNWKTNTWPVTSSWSQDAGGWWAHIALECGHVKNPIGTVPNTAPYFAPVGMRVLRINQDAAEPYIVISFLGSKVATQSGSGIYKFRIKAAPKNGGLEIEKRDHDRRTLTGQGDASLDPTTFEVSYAGEGTVTIDGASYSTGDAIMRLETTGGVARTAADALPEGTYSVREISTPAGYRLSDAASRTVTITGDAVTRLVGDNAFRNAVVRGGVTIEKRDAESRLLTPQGDASLDGTAFEIVNRSAQPVYVDGASYDPGQVCCRLTIANGRAATASDALPYGTYEIRETKPGTGYLLSDAMARTFRIRSDGDVARYLADESFFDQVIRGGVVVEKRDSESRLTTPLGGASLDGTVFEITNESRNAVLVNGSWADPGDVCCRIAARDGRAETAPDALPYGTYSIKEVLPGEGYLHTDTASRTFRIGIQGQLYRFVEDDAFFNQVKRGDITFVKTSEDDMARLVGVPFRLTSQTTGESHVLVTDENGRVDTSSAWIAHTQNTNANDAALAPDGTIDATALDMHAGTWFGQTTEGWLVDVDDRLCALPYDTYTLEELRCPANEGLALVTIKDITIQRDLTKVDLGTIDDKGSGSVPDITTFASDALDLDRIVTAGPAASIIDRVSYTNLTPNETYLLRATLVDQESGEAIEGSATELAFEPAASSGEVDVTITADLTTATSRRVVVFEELVRNDIVVAEHQSLDDSGQTVIVAEPRLKTSARNAASGNKTLSPGGAISVIDTVSYANLTPGVAYALEGALMTEAYDDEAQSAYAVPLRDAEGTPATSVVEFVPTEASGEVEVAFDVPSPLIEDGAKVIAYETLKCGDAVIATHCDPTDAAQTLTMSAIEMHTRAADAASDDKVAFADADCTIVDDVRLTGVVPGTRYHVLGIVMDPATGLPALPSVADEREPTPDAAANDADGAPQLADAERLPQAEGTSDGTNASNRESAPNAAVEQFWSTLTGMLGISSAPSDGDDYFIFSTEPQAIDAKEVLAYVEASVTELDGLAIETASITPTQPEHTLAMTYDLGPHAQPGSYVVCNVLMADNGVAATHLDLASSLQTFSVASLDAPMISTSVRDAHDGDREIAPAGKAELIDAVTYTGLDAGAEYTMNGFLMDKATEDVFLVDGAMVTSEVIFTPTAADGAVDMPFGFDASALATGAELVVFEQLFKDGELVAEHTDLADAAQTIAVRTPASAGSLRQTGDSQHELMYALVILGGCAGAIVAGCGILGWRRSKREDEQCQRLLR